MSPVTTRTVDGRDEYMGADGNWYPLWVRPTRAEGEKPESADRRRTRTNEALLAQGKHPATRLPLLDSAPPRCCGECVHHQAVRHAKTYHKCERHRLGITASGASDIRVGWPACVEFKAVA